MMNIRYLFINYNKNIHEWIYIEMSLNCKKKWKNRTINEFKTKLNKNLYRQLQKNQT